jgi:hypothetical protein
MYGPSIHIQIYQHTFICIYSYIESIRPSVTCCVSQTVSEIVVEMCKRKDCLIVLNLLHQLNAHH